MIINYDLLIVENTSKTGQFVQTVTSQLSFIMIEK